MSHNLFEHAQNSRSRPAKPAVLLAARARAAGVGKVSRLPVSIRIVLESVLRNCDGKKVTQEHVKELATWKPTAERVDEDPVRGRARGAAGLHRRAAARRPRGDAQRRQRLRQESQDDRAAGAVDLVVDHSVMIDHYGTKEALDLNMKLEFERNNERYQFMKWGMQAFATVRRVPPASASCTRSTSSTSRAACSRRTGVYYPDSLVGTDSHTTMVNGIGVVAWGRGRHRSGSRACSASLFIS
jgi:aconitate hydratase